MAELRKARRLTQMSLAKAVGSWVEFVSLVKCGVNAPPVAGLERFAEALKMEVGELFHLEQSPRSMPLPWPVSIEVK